MYILCVTLSPQRKLELFKVKKTDFITNALASLPTPIKSRRNRRDSVPKTR